MNHWIGMTESQWNRYYQMVTQVRGIYTTLTIWYQYPQGTLLEQVGSILGSASPPANCQSGSSWTRTLALGLEVQSESALPSDLIAYAIYIMDGLRSIPPEYQTDSSVSELTGRSVAAYVYGRSHLQPNTWRLRESLDKPASRGVEWRLAAIRVEG